MRSKVVRNADSGLPSRQRAVEADARVAAIDHRARIIVAVSLAIILLLTAGTAVASVIAAMDARQAAKAAVAATATNHVTGLENHTILEKILKTQHNHTQTVAGEKVIVEDLRRITRALGLRVILFNVPAATPVSVAPTPTSTTAPRVVSPRPTHHRSARPTATPTATPSASPTPTPTCSVFIILAPCVRVR